MKTSSQERTAKGELQGSRFGFTDLETLGRSLTFPAAPVRPEREDALPEEGPGSGWGSGAPWRSFKSPCVPLMLRPGSHPSWKPSALICTLDTGFGPQSQALDACAVLLEGPVSRGRETMWRPHGLPSSPPPLPPRTELTAGWASPQGLSTPPPSQPGPQPSTNTASLATLPGGPVLPS